MSGRKEVTIDEAEYRRLLQDTRRLRELQSHLPEILEAVRRESAEDLRRRLEPLERRQQEFRRALEGVAEQVREFEEETSRRLEEQQRQMRSQIREVREALAEQERRFNAMLEQERRTRQQQIQNVQRQLDAIMADKERARTLAQGWLEAAEKLREFIEDNYRHDLFSPGRLDCLARTLEQGRENLNQGMSEAALTQSQSAYQELSDLRLELERLEREWHLWRSAALESAREMLELARRNRQCKAVDLEGKELDLGVEVDWWTEGKLSALEEELNRLLARIQDESSFISTEEFRHIVEQTIPQMQERLEQVIREARLAVLGSQLRANVADLVVQALEEQGFQLEDGTYEGEDQRRGFVAKVRHLDGSEVVVVVAPKEGDPAQNDLQIHSFDVAQRSEHELRARARELARALQSKGLQVGEPQAVGAAQPDPAVRDIEQVRKRTAVERRTQ